MNLQYNEIGNNWVDIISITPINKVWEELMNELLNKIFNDEL